MPAVPALIGVAGTLGASAIGANAASIAAKKTASASGQTSEQKALEKQLYELLYGKATGDTPSYTGQMTAPASSYETQGLELLNKYLTSQPSSYYGLAGNELAKTMGGEYDPASSPFYQAMRTSQMANLEEAKKGLGSDLSARGLFYSPARTKGVTDLTEGVTNNLNLTLGQMAENERSRRLSSVPYAMQLGGIEENRPALMAQMAMELGSLPRELQRADLNAKYQDYLKGLDLDQNTINSILTFLGRLQANQSLGMQSNLASTQAGLAAGQAVGGGASALFNALSGLFTTTPSAGVPTSYDYLGNTADYQPGPY